ncbi:hypothetical protein AOQ84DRAFT_377094 [Glonium stellatum]|uniref:Uncharacterized protein n=1 Tax=Glonium stellatum TaxID=574774 RepID=A0A8E2JSR1_9PEZI|nr:hypothetical protein AOQ84DRAFT_377094 [Glonium stellatum]
MSRLYNLARQNPVLGMVVAVFSIYQFAMTGQRPVQGPQAAMINITQAEEEAFDAITYPKAFPEIVPLSETRCNKMLPFLAYNTSPVFSTYPSSPSGIPSPTSNHYDFIGWPIALTLLFVLLQLLPSAQHTQGRNSLSRVVILLFVILKQLAQFLPYILPANHPAAPLAVMVSTSCGIAPGIAWAVKLAFDRLFIRNQHSVNEGNTPEVSANQISSVPREEMGSLDQAAKVQDILEETRAQFSAFKQKVAGDMQAAVDAARQQLRKDHKIEFHSQLEIQRIEAESKVKELEMSFKQREADLNAQIAKQEDKIEALKASFSKVYQNMDEDEDEGWMLRGKRNELSAMLEVLKSRKIDKPVLEKAINDLHAEIDRLLSAPEKLTKADFDVQTPRFELRLIPLRNEYSDLVAPWDVKARTKEIADLKEEVSVLAANNQALEDALEHAHDEAETRDVTLKELTEQLEAKEKSEKDLAAKNKQLRAEGKSIPKLIADNAALKDASERAQKEVGARDITVKELNEQLRAKDKSMNDIMAENAMLNNASKRTADEVRALDATIKELNEQLKAKEKNEEDLTAQNEKLRAASDNAEEQIISLFENILSLEADLYEAKTSAAESLKNTGAQTGVLVFDDEVEKGQAEGEEEGGEDEGKGNRELGEKVQKEEGQEEEEQGENGEEENGKEEYVTGLGFARQHDDSEDDFDALFDDIDDDGDGDDSGDNGRDSDEDAVGEDYSEEEYSVEQYSEDDSDDEDYAVGKTSATGGIAGAKTPKPIPKDSMPGVKFEFTLKPTIPTMAEAAQPGKAGPQIFKPTPSELPMIFGPAPALPSIAPAIPPPNPVDPAPSLNPMPIDEILVGETPFNFSPPTGLNLPPPPPPSSFDPGKWDFSNSFA